MNNRSNVGKGGLVIYPFLDLNRNNRRDKDEPKIQGLELKINGGRIQNNVKDTTVQVFDLEPYNSYLLELNRSSFDNIAWQLKNAAYKVTIEPNMLKLIEVPVMVSAEASGMIYGTAADSTGQGRIIVNFYREGIFAGRTLSESDGYFNFLGLAPGTYTACIDSAQLAKLKMAAAPNALPFTIALSMDGEVVDDINFKLQKTEIQTAAIIKAPDAVTPLPADKVITSIRGEDVKPAEIPAAGEIQPPLLVSSAITKIDTVSEDQNPAAGEKAPSSSTGKNAGTLNDAGYSIKINAVGDRTSAQNLQNNLMQQYGHTVKVYFEGTNSYQLSILGFENRANAEAFLPVLAKHGLKNPYIATPRAVFKPAVKQNDVRFQIMAGRAANQAEIERAQELIQKTLNRSAFPVNDAEGFRLFISGYPDRNSAEQDYLKLLGAGMEKGSISAYKEKLVELVDKGAVIKAAKNPIKTPSKTSEQLPAASVRTKSPRDTAGNQENPGILRFRVVAGLVSDEANIKNAQDLILKILNVPSYPLKDGKIFHLHISGFKDRTAAENAYQKLIAAGLLPGYITTYREKPVKIK
jgi:hypothetical protein